MKINSSKLEIKDFWNPSYLGFACPTECPTDQSLPDYNASLLLGGDEPAEKSTVSLY